MSGFPTNPWWFSTKPPFAPQKASLSFITQCSQYLALAHKKKEQYHIYAHALVSPIHSRPKPCRVMSTEVSSLHENASRITCQAWDYLLYREKEALYTSSLPPPTQLLCNNMQNPWRSMYVVDMSSPLFMLRLEN